MALELAGTLEFLRRYAEAETYVDRGMLLTPEEGDGVRLKCALAIDVRGNVPEAIEHLRNAIGKVRPHSELTFAVMDMAWPAVEDPSLRKLIIDAQASPDLPPGDFYVNKARIYLYLKDQSRARAYADSAISALEIAARTSPEAADAYMQLAFAHAARGRRDDALRSFARAEQLLPAEKDAFIAGQRENMRPIIYVLLGENEAAISALEKRVEVIGGLSRNAVRLDPIFASLRGNPRFEQLIRSS